MRHRLGVHTLEVWVSDAISRKPSGDVVVIDPELTALFDMAQRASLRRDAEAHGVQLIFQFVARSPINKG